MRLLLHSFLSIWNAHFSFFTFDICFIHLAMKSGCFGAPFPFRNLYLILSIYLCAYTSWLESDITCRMFLFFIFIIIYFFPWMLVAIFFLMLWRFFCLSGFHFGQYPKSHLTWSTKVHEAISIHIYHQDGSIKFCSCIVYN